MGLPKTYRRGFFRLTALIVIACFLSFDLCWASRPSLVTDSPVVEETLRAQAGLESNVEEDLGKSLQPAPGRRWTGSRSRRLWLTAAMLFGLVLPTGFFSSSSSAQAASHPSPAAAAREADLRQLISPIVEDLKQSSGKWAVMLLTINNAREMPPEDHTTWKDLASLAQRPGVRSYSITVDTENGALDGRIELTGPWSNDPVGKQIQGGRMDYNGAFSPAIKDLLGGPHFAGVLVVDSQGRILLVIPRYTGRWGSRESRLLREEIDRLVALEVQAAAEAKAKTDKEKAQREAAEAKVAVEKTREVAEEAQRAKDRQETVSVPFEEETTVTPAKPSPPTPPADLKPPQPSAEVKPLPPPSQPDLYLEATFEEESKPTDTKLADTKPAVPAGPDVPSVEGSNYSTWLKIAAALTGLAVVGGTWDLVRRIRQRRQRQAVSPPASAPAPVTQPAPVASQAAGQAATTAPATVDVGQAPVAAVETAVATPSAADQGESVVPATIPSATPAPQQEETLEALIGRLAEAQPKVPWPAIASSARDDPEGFQRRFGALIKRVPEIAQITDWIRRHPAQAGPPAEQAAVSRQAPPGAGLEEDWKEGSPNSILWQFLVENLVPGVQWGQLSEENRQKAIAVIEGLGREVPDWEGLPSDEQERLVRGRFEAEGILPVAAAAIEPAPAEVRLVEEAAQLIDFLAQQLEQAQAELALAKGEADRERGQAAAASRRVEQLEAEVTRLSGELSAAQANEANQRQEASEASQKVQTLSAQVSELQPIAAKVPGLQMELTQKKGQLNTLTRELGELKTQLDNARADLKREQEERKAAEERERQAEERERQANLLLKRVGRQISAGKGKGQRQAGAEAALAQRVEMWRGKPEAPPATTSPAAGPVAPTPPAEPLRVVEEVPPETNRELVAGTFFVEGKGYEISRRIQGYKSVQGGLGPVQIDAFAQREQGGRQDQQDRYALEILGPKEDPLALLAVVADGMGGQAAGAFASEKAVEQILHRINPVTVPEGQDRQQAERFLQQLRAYREGSDEAQQQAGVMGIAKELGNVIGQAHRELFGLQADPNDPEHTMRRGMGTTVVMALILDRHYIVLGVGDSPAFAFEGGKMDLLLPLDSTRWRQAEVELREGQPGTGSPPSYQQIHDRMRRVKLPSIVGGGGVLEYHLGQSGTDRQTGRRVAKEIPVRFVVRSLEPGSQLLLASDGIDMLTPDAIEKTLAGNPTRPARDGVNWLMGLSAAWKGAKDLPQELLDQLPGPLDEYGDSHRNGDNRTVLLVKVQSSSPSAEQAGLEETATAVLMAEPPVAPAFTGIRWAGSDGASLSSQGRFLADHVSSRRPAAPPIERIYLVFDQAAGKPLIEVLGVETYVVVTSPKEAKSQVGLGVEPERLIGITGKKYSQGDYLVEVRGIKHFIEADTTRQGWKKQVFDDAVVRLFEESVVVAIHGRDSLVTTLQFYQFSESEISQVLQARAGTEEALSRGL